MTICVCDDNLVQLNTVISIINDYIIKNTLSDIIINTPTPRELKDSLERRIFSYSLAILDIELGIINGIDAAKQINQISPACRIIFITGFQKYKLQVYEAKHMYFVPKNLMNIYLRKALDKTVKDSTYHHNTRRSFILKTKAEHYILPMMILFIWSSMVKKPRYIPVPALSIILQIRYP